MAAPPSTGKRLMWADVLERIGDVPASRICAEPPPGTATEQDVVAALEGEDKCLYELVDGILVEKAVGAEESQLALIIGQLLLNYLRTNPRGILLGPDGLLRILPGLVRGPDVSFLSRARLTEGRLPRRVKVPALVPDLAIEVLSPSNTRQEMRRKLKDYFLAGVSEAWLISPLKRTADIYTSPTDKKHIGTKGALTSPALLPGFSLSLPELFAALTLPPET
jgi:Uma2 family endonuclease